MKLLMFVATLLISTPAHAGDNFADFDVEWPPSGEPGIHLLVITIDTCATRFRIKTEDFYKFSNDPDMLTKAVKLALEHSSSGCVD